MASLPSSLYYNNFKIGPYRALLSNSKKRPTPLTCRQQQGPRVHGLPQEVLLGLLAQVRRPQPVQLVVRGRSRSQGRPGRGPGAQAQPLQTRLGREDVLDHERRSSAEFLVRIQGVEGVVGTVPVFLGHRLHGDRLHMMDRDRFKWGFDSLW